MLDHQERTPATPHRAFGVPTVDDLPHLGHKSVLVRATLDLPLVSGSPIAELRRSRLAATVRDLRKLGADVTVFGDTKTAGRGPDDATVSRMIEDIGATPVLAGPCGSIENPAFLEDLVDRYDVFVNESFQWSYLPLPSLTIPAERLPSAAGRGLEADLSLGASLLCRPRRPFVAVLGGANSPLRLHRLQGVILRADHVLVGGAMSLPLLAAVGKRTAIDLAPEFINECRALVGLGERVEHRIQLPLDLTVRRPDGSLEVVSSSQVLEGDVVDIGPRTIQQFFEFAHGADTVLWAGALGDVDDPHSTTGTLAVADGLRAGSARVVVAGDSLAALLEDEGRLRPSFDVVSATDSLLELLKNGDLPALPPLRSRRVDR